MAFELQLSQIGVAETLFLGFLFYRLFLFKHIVFLRFCLIFGPS